jgi:hypothetical protein
MLFCLTEYTAQALNAMCDKPNENRRDAVNQVLEAAGEAGSSNCMARPAMVLVR